MFVPNEKDGNYRYQTMFLYPVKVYCYLKDETRACL